MKTLEDILAGHPFWNNLPPQYFPLLIECAVIERFQPGEQIFKTSYDADHFYLIHQSKVALETAYVPGEGFITIQTLGAGEALGWSWLSSSQVAFQCAGGRADGSSCLLRRMHCVTKQKKSPPSDTILPCE